MAEIEVTRLGEERGQLGRGIDFQTLAQGQAANRFGQRFLSATNGGSSASGGAGRVRPGQVSTRHSASRIVMAQPVMAAAVQLSQQVWKQISNIRLAEIMAE